jgi:hypothetical protein
MLFSRGCQAVEETGEGMEFPKVIRERRSEWM